jgi:hypothetical protein
MILHDTIDIQKREDANWCSNYVVPNYNFNYQKQTNFRIGSGSCLDLKHGSPMFRMFRKPVSVLDEKRNKTIMWFRIMFQIHLKEMRPWLPLWYLLTLLLECRYIAGKNYF